MSEPGALSAGLFFEGLSPVVMTSLILWFRRFWPIDFQRLAENQSPFDLAWNNFISHSRPDIYETGSAKWAAATAARFMGQVCNGGFNYFLTCSWEFDARSVEEALTTIGASRAAAQFGLVLNQIGRPLLSSSEEERWSILEECWSERLNEIDRLSGQAYSELMATLEAHVVAEERFYLGL